LRVPVGSRTVGGVRRGALLLSILTLLAIGWVVGPTSASAQSRDPFRPPAGSGTVGGSGSTGGARPPPAAEPPPGTNDDLAHTGQDVAGVVALGLSLIALGTGLSAAGRVFEVSPRRA